MIHLRIVVENPADNLATAAYGAGALIYVESDVAVPNTFVQFGTAALVAGTTLYNVWHSAGTAATQYRYRIGNAGGTVFGTYSAVFTGSSTVTYASIEQLTGTVPDSGIAAAAQGRAYACLLEASRELDGAIGWDFLTHAAGEVRTVDTSGSTWRVGPVRGDRLNLNPAGTRLCVHSGIVSLTKLEVSWNAGGAYEEVVSGDYTLLPRSPLYEEPYDHIELSPTSSTFTVFPTWAAAVRMTGQFGYAAPPRRIQSATLAMGRQKLRGDSTMGGGVVGPESYPVTLAPDHFWPKAAWDALEFYRRKFRCSA